MKKANILIVIILFLASCKNADAYREIDYAKSFDFGEIKVGQSIEHTFEIKNKSDEPLKIGKLGTSCGCTAAIISDSTVAGHGVAHIKVSFHSDENKIGDVKNTIVFTANTKPSINLITLSGKVKG